MLADPDIQTDYLLSFVCDVGELLKQVRRGSVAVTPTVLLMMIKRCESVQIELEEVKTAKRETARRKRGGN